MPVYIIAGAYSGFECASPFTLLSFVSVPAKNLKSIKDHGINAKITLFTSLAA